MIKEEIVTPVISRKTLLALAVTAAALPAYAQTLQLTNAGIEINDETYSESVEVSGSFTSSNSDLDAIEFNSVIFDKDLVLNATINASGNNAAGLDLSMSGEDEDPYSFGSATEILGNLVNKGSISVVGNGNVGMLVESAVIHGNLINEGTLSVKGEVFEGDSVRALEFSGQSEIHGDLINAASGKIIAEGPGATGIQVHGNLIDGQLVNFGKIQVTGNNARGIHLAESFFSQLNSNTLGYPASQLDQLSNEEGALVEANGEAAIGILISGARLDGKLINKGGIRATGAGATGIDISSQELGSDYGGPGYGRDPVFGPGPLPWNSQAIIGGVENSGRIIAQGDGAVGLLLDGVMFGHAGYSTRHVINTGVIDAQGAAIKVGTFDIEGESADYPLRIQNSGNIASQGNTIDASEATAPVYLDWDAGTISGNLIDLSNIEINGNVTFNGTDATVDGANIRMKDGAWIDVGSTSDQIVGHLELGQAHTSIDGNIYVAGNSSLGMSLSNATDPSKAVLEVSGTAEFGNGAQIKLAAKGSDFTVQGADYKLIQADEIDDYGLSVVSSSSLLKVDTYAVDGNQVVAKVTGKGAGEVGQVIGNSGGSSNAQAAGGAFSQLLLNQLAQSNPNDPVGQAFIAASENPAALAKLAEQLAPETNGGATQAATSGQTLISNITGNRTSGARQGLSSGDALTETGAWVQALYSDANQDLRDGIAGYNAYSRGIAVGADGKLNDQLTLGLAYSFLNTDVNSNNGNTTEVDGHAFTLYGGFEQGNYFIDASLTYGINDNEGQRHIAGTTAKGDYDSNLLGVNLVGGYSYHLSDELLIEPRLAARYSMVDIDGFSEKGSAAALKAEDQRYEVAELGTGLRVAANYPLGQGTIEPQAKLMAYHDFAADQASSTSTFVLGGTPFATAGAKPARSSYEAGVGVDYHLGAVTLGASYDYLGKTDFNTDTFTAKVRYDF